jgi:hypothetical protein
LLRYADKAALDGHMASSPVAAVIKLFTDTPDVLARPTHVMTCTAAAAMVRPAVADMSDPVISLSTISYAADAKKSAASEWEKTVKEAERTGDGLSMVLEDNDTGLIRVVEVGKGRSVAVSGAGIGNGNVEATVEVRAVEGYWWKRNDGGARLS